MLRGLWELTWLETKIFVREPLGLIGTVGLPVATFVLMGRLFRDRPGGPPTVSALLTVEMPILAVLLISLSAVLSLVTIVAIYRESGILKRLRATPLRPHTILTAQVLVKLLFTLLTMAALLLAGKRYYPVQLDVSVASFALALTISTVAILSLGFVIASVVPTARFAQPIGTLIFLSDDRAVRPVRADRIPAAGASRRRAPSPADLHRVAAEGDLAGRPVVGARRRSRRAAGDFHGLHGRLRASVSVGMSRPAGCGDENGSCQAADSRRKSVKPALRAVEGDPARR